LQQIYDGPIHKADFNRDLQTNITEVIHLSSLQQNFDDLSQKVLSGQILEAFEAYYADDVVMQEDSEEPREGKEANRAYEEQFVNSVEGFHDGKVTAVAVNEEDGTVLSEWFMDVTLKDAGRIQIEQVSVQRWEDGQIVHERFYHA
jgi:ketosteroid isomerase-like protein